LKAASAPETSQQAWPG